MPQSDEGNRFHKSAREIAVTDFIVVASYLMYRIGEAHDSLSQEGHRTRQGCREKHAELVMAARRGDKRAFVEIVARHQAMVCGIAFSVLSDFAASEDAAQEAFLTAGRKFQHLREPDRLRGWLAQIARNAALGYLRREKEIGPLDEVLNVADSNPAPDEAVFLRAG